MSRGEPGQPLDPGGPRELLEVSLLSGYGVSGMAHILPIAVVQITDYATDVLMVHPVPVLHISLAEHRPRASTQSARVVEASTAGAGEVLLR